MPYPTPEVIPLETKCKQIIIPDHPLIWGAVNGAMVSLMRAYNWEQQGAVTAIEMAEHMRPLVYDFLDGEFCEEGTPDPGACTEYAPDVPFIEYNPNDPFQTPDDLPPGYNVPPWYTNPGIPLPGVLPGDAMVNLLAFPVNPLDWPGVISSGLPRARLHFEGEGEVEIEFVKVIQGGYAVVVIDDDPLTNQWIDLTSVSIIGAAPLLAIFDIITGELSSTTVLELDISGSGAHHVDITFVPRIDETTLFGFGGGIRRVSLCGFNLPGATIMPEFRVSADGCHVEIQVNPSAPWVELPGGDICGADGEDGIDAEINLANYRVTNCQLELLVASVWTPIPNADWLRRDGTCAMPGRLTVGQNTIDTNAQVVAINSGGSGQVFQAKASGTGGGTSFGFHANLQRTGSGARSVGFYMTPTAGIINQAFRAEGLPAVGANLFLFHDGTAPSIHNGKLTVGANLTDNATLNAHEIIDNGDTVSPIVRIVRNPTNAGINKWGSVQFAGKTSVAIQKQAIIKTKFDDITDATRKSRLEIEVSDWVGNQVALRLAALGGTTSIGFLGAADLPAQVLPNLAAETAAVQYIARKLRDFGLFTESPISPPPEIYDFCATYDFLAAGHFTLYDFNPGAPVETTGEHVSLTGWVVNDDLVTGVESVAIEKRFSVAQTINYIRFEWTITGVSGGGEITEIASVQQGGVWTDFYSVERTIAGNYAFTSITERTNVTAVRFWLANTGAFNATGVITSAELRGSGTTPGDIGGDAC